MFKTIISICLGLALLCSSLLASTKTLPKGVFKLDTYYNFYDVENLGANPSGDKATWETVKLTEGKMSDIYLFTFCFVLFFFVFLEVFGAPGAPGGLSLIHISEPTRPY